MGPLDAANVVAWVLMGLALLRVLSHRRIAARSEEGRALLVLASATFMLASTGMVRRLAEDYADSVALAAYTVLAACGFWLMTQNRIWAYPKSQPPEE